LYTDWPCEILAFGLTSGRCQGHVTSIFWKIINIISEMVYNTDIVTMED